MKRNKILYWTTTSLVSAGFLLSSMMYLTRNPELMATFSKAGYPVYFVMLLGVAKLFGSLALINPWWDKLKEWAYAGFTFTLTGAIWTHISTGTSVVAPLIFLVLILTSYYFRRKMTTPQLQTA